MKTLSVLTIILAGTFTSWSQNTDRQPLPQDNSDKMGLLDVYGIVPRAFTGGGFGLGGFSPSLPGFVLPGLTEFRLGGDFYFSSLDRNIIRDVPLLQPQTGNAKVKLNEHIFGLNLAARLSAPWRQKVTPYIDGFAGLRAVTCGISTTPNQYQPGYEESSHDNLDAAFAFNYGFSAGVLVSIAPTVKINAAMMYTRSEWPGMIKDIRSAALIDNTIYMDIKQLPQEQIMFKLGLTILIDGSEPGRHANCCCNCCVGRTSRPSYSRIPLSRSSNTNRVVTKVKVAK